jgi:hypothetical protein
MSQTNKDPELAGLILPCLGVENQSQTLRMLMNRKGDPTGTKREVGVAGELVEEALPGNLPECDSDLP